MESSCDRKKIESTVIKYTVLTVWSSFTTLVFLIFMCFMVMDEDSLVIRNIANTLNTLDTLSNIITMTLTFKFADDGYNMLCVTCNDCLFRLCGMDEVKDERPLTNEIGTNMILVDQKSDGATKQDEIVGENSAGMKFVIR